MSDEGRLQAVDFQWLETYAAHDETLVRQVLTVFTREAAGWAGHLDAGADWRPVVHTIKGTSRSIGATGLGELCARAERDGEARLGEVRAELARVVGEIADYLARRGGPSG